MHIGYQRTGAPYELDPAHLRTHGVCVGMTGSRKTGLCIALLEELALRKVPILLLDPKGDLANMMFIPRSPEQLAALVPVEESQRAGMHHEQYCGQLWARFDKARVEDGATAAKLDRMCETLFRIYTPGG